MSSILYTVNFLARHDRTFSNNVDKLLRIAERLHRGGERLQRVASRI